MSDTSLGEKYGCPSAKKDECVGNCRDCPYIIGTRGLGHPFTFEGGGHLGDFLKTPSGRKLTSKIAEKRVAPHQL